MKQNGTWLAFQKQINANVAAGMAPTSSQFVQDTATAALTGLKANAGNLAITGVSAIDPVVGAGRILELLKPAGQLIGTLGDGYTVRELTGGAAAAERLFDELSVGGEPYQPTNQYPGKLIKFPDGSFVGYRPAAGGKPPTIDINTDALKEITELKFLE